MSNSTLYAAQTLLKQIDSENSQCSFWLFSAINRLLILDENLSLKDFFLELKDLNPESFENFKEYAESIDIKIVS